MNPSGRLPPIQRMLSFYFLTLSISYKSFDSFLAFLLSSFLYFWVYVQIFITQHLDYVNGLHIVFLFIINLVAQHITLKHFSEHVITLLENVVFSEIGLNFQTWHSRLFMIKLIFSFPNSYITTKVDFHILRAENIAEKKKRLSVFAFHLLLNKYCGSIF